MLALGLILLGSLLGSLYAFLGALFRGPKPDTTVLPARVPRPPKPTGPPIFVDGSNVMHWGGQGPSARPLALVLGQLQAKGFVPVVWFDANVGYKLGGQHMGRLDLARMLSLPPASIHLAPSGQPADPLVIKAALDAKARLVSNDRFMDWREQFPGLRAKHVLVKGTVRGDHVDLTL